MKTKTYVNLISYIKTNGPQRPADLAAHFGVSPQALHSHLRKGVASKDLERIGLPPHTRYGIASKALVRPILDERTSSVIARNFSYLVPTGSMLTGVDAFNAWIDAKGLGKDYVDLANAYRKMHQEIYSGISGGPIDTLSRLSQILPSCVLDSAKIADFYALPQFGKTRLGNLLHAVKTSFRQSLFEQIVTLVGTEIRDLCRINHIDAVLFVPHSIPRKKQLLPALQKYLSLPFPTIEARKVFKDGIPVAQKSLSKLNERIENAANTVFLPANRNGYRSVLIIDDAIGSGGTINEIARKLKHDHHVKKCHAYAIVGSYKGFDVISAV